MQVSIAFYKPDNVLSSFTGSPGQITLTTYIPIPGVYSAGRLDRDSEGLLILTNDGSLNHRLTDPKHHFQKTYFVQVEGHPNDQQIRNLAKGVMIGGKMTRRCEVTVVSEPKFPPKGKPITPHGPTSWLRIVLTEGRKRQIRHMTASVGLPTLRLVRVSIGPVSLGNMIPGEWRYLTEDELARLSRTDAEMCKV